MNPPLQAWTHVIGWTLIHFVWQGGLLAIAVAAGVRLCRRRTPEVRYAIACAGLTAMLAAPAITAGILLDRSATLPADSHVALRVTGDATAIERQSTSAAGPATNGAPDMRTRLEAWLPYVVWAWAAGVVLLLARFAGGSWRVHRLRAASRAEPTSPWQAASERIAERLGLVVAFKVVESALVDTPSVIGFMRPLVLLPIAALSSLSPGQVEALLAHELAHIRRRDYAVNLLQTVAETLLFFHPAIWWVSSRIREAREYCCDDVAVKVCGEPAAYAAALAELATWRAGGIALSVGATDGPLLVRVRRLLGAPEEHVPQSIGGLAAVAGAIMLAAGVAVQSSAQSSVPPAGRATNQPVVQKARQVPADWLTRQTDHFDLHYPPDLDLHAERAAQEAEHAYERVSSDLRHNLAFRVPVLLFRNSAELAASAPRVGQSPLASFADPSGDRILFATDQPADRWLGLLTHEVAHVFGFDILPGTGTPRWILEGLAEYQRGAWDPADLAALRGAVRADSLSAIAILRADDGTTPPRLIQGVGHAAFDFIESRWGKPGVRQFLFGVRQTARDGGDPFDMALQIRRDEFERAFDRYLRDRLAAPAAPPLANRFDDGATVRLEGEITALRAPAAAGLACIELWVPIEGGNRQRWGIECATEPARALVGSLQPGDHVIVIGAPAAQRVALASLERPADGMRWPAALR